MTIETTTQPAAEPLDIQEVKTFLNVTSNDHDAMIELFVKMAREWAEHVTGLALLSQTVKQYWDEWPDGVFDLGKSPATSVTSIQYVDENGATQTWSATNYTADLKSTPPRIFPTENVDYPALGKYPNAVICTYVTGYATPLNVPARIKAAMLQQIAFLYENREDIPVNGVGGSYRVRSADALIFNNRIRIV